VPALIKLGVMAAAGKDFEKAAQYLDRARIADPANAQAMLWRAIVAEKQQNPADADSLFRQAAESRQTDKSEELVAADLYARFLVRQGRIKDAAPLRDKVDALREALRPVAPPKPAAGVHKIGGAVAAPKLVQKVEPAYSEEARLAQYEGRVVIYTEIGPDGRAHNTRVMRGLGLGLDERAIDAIGQWRFEPGKKDGRPVTVAATIEVNFRLL
jgi:TonB family protein